MKKIFILLFLVSIPVVAQDGEPSYRFKLENKEYAIYITQSDENATSDTLYYNLYRLGSPKRIAKEIKEIVDKATNEIVAESYYNVSYNKIVFYFSAKGKEVMERAYTQNKKGLLGFKSAVNKIPPPEQIRVDFYNEYSTEDSMVPVVAVYEAVEQVDEVAEYPGGIDKLRQFLSATINYPRLAIENNVNGKVVATFIVEKDGTISTIKILKSLGFGCDEEVIRILNLSSKWKPAQLNGKPVRSIYTLPVAFVAVE